MVCFKRVVKRDKPNIFQDWWKLNDPQYANIKQVKNFLKTRKFYCPSDAKKARIGELYVRDQRGFISYDALAVNELLQFYHARIRDMPLGGQTLLKAGKPSKADLVKVLEEADANSSFHHFSDLPAELRVRVYTLYFGSIGVLDRPAQPPITMVSRLLRKEALPVFYQTCTFKLDIAIGDPIWAHRSGRHRSASHGASNYR